jgi:hypothetical protein
MSLYPRKQSPCSYWQEAGRMLWPRDRSPSNYSDRAVLPELLPKIQTLRTESYDVRFGFLTEFIMKIQLSGLCHYAFWESRTCRGIIWPPCSTLKTALSQKSLYMIEDPLHTDFLLLDPGDDGCGVCLRKAELSPKTSLSASTTQRL